MERSATSPEIWGGMDAISAADIVDAMRSSLLVLDENLLVQSANRAFFQTFHATREDTIGRSIYELGKGQWNIPTLRTLLTEVIPRNEVVEGFEVEHDFPSIGRKVMLLDARRLYRHGNPTPLLLLTIDDVTEARDVRRESELHWRLTESIVDTIRDPLLVLESDMSVVAASQAFLRLFNTTAEKTVGRSLYDLANGQWKVGKLQELLARVVPDNAAFNGFEIEDEFAGHGRRIFRLNARKVLQPDNHVTRLLLIFEDVTEARLLENHRDLLAAEMAHRIKNSLTIITGFVSFEIRRAAEPCVQGYKSMQARINAVAQLYDVISKSATVGPVPMRAYLNGIAASLRASLLDERSQIEIVVTAEPLAIGPDHAVTVGLIVNELATNAIKHAFPRGSGKLELGFGRRGEEVALTISDDGIGLTNPRDDFVGSGLGSRFVEAFVHQIGGTLATATGVIGTTFTVRLPATVLASEMT